jgi:opacity protein-like surface antigen
MSWYTALVTSLAVLGCASPTFAQGTYVGAALTGDIVRFDRSETSRSGDVRSGGEALGFALRIGTPLGSIWGVEAEFVYPSAIESESWPEVIALPSPIVTSGPIGGIDLFPIVYPPISYRVRTSWRTSTISTGVWARHNVSERVALVYSGGAAFNRTENEFEFTFTPLPAVTLPSSRTKTILYSVQPFAGIGARIGMTEHLELVPSARILGLERGLLVRPSIGVAWTF